MKQRIIGALVLVSLAVIFVPMIFDEPHSERQSTPITIPEEPPFPEVDMPANQSAEYRSATEQEQAPSVVDSEVPEPDAGYRLVEGDGAPVTVAESPAQPVEPAAPVPSEEAPVRTDPVPPQITESAASTDSGNETEQAEFSKTLEGAWVVQLGSFGNADNARRLRDKVVEMDYGAHLQQLSRGDVELTRVFSGPFVNEAEAEKAKAVLDKAFGLNSLVTSGGK